jgi:hypothetical protein
MPVKTAKKHSSIKTIKTSTNKHIKREKKKIEANAGAIVEGFGGFTKIDKNPNVKGDCIQKNSEKIANIWDKIKGSTDYVKLRYFRIQAKSATGVLGYYIQHIAIVDLKNDKFIDISNGRTRMISLDAYMRGNNIMGYFDISFDSVFDMTLEICGGNLKAQKMLITENIVSIILRKICCEYFIINKNKNKNPVQPSPEYIINKLKPSFKIETREYDCENNIRALK